MVFQHSNMAAGKWFGYTLCQQMGNIGSEVGRAARWQDKDLKLFEGAVFRAIELLDLTLTDPRWKKRFREIARARETVCDAFTGGKEYNSKFSELEQYFYHYAYAARNSVGRKV
jgi:hypothetical protein